MGFVKFTETGKSFTPKATISPRGMISFNDGSRRKYKLDAYKCCVLYYDYEDKKVGIELTNDESAEGAVKLRLRATGADIGAKSFIDFFEIAPEVTTMYFVTSGNEENWLVIDLGKGRERKGKKDEPDNFQ
jgi:hypothetical protein